MAASSAARSRLFRVAATLALVAQVVGLALAPPSSVSVARASAAAMVRIAPPGVAHARGRGHHPMHVCLGLHHRSIGGRPLAAPRPMAARAVLSPAAVVHDPARAARDPDPARAPPVRA
ncbi:MAG TPA: hypothetical protein VF041_21255 [Gemmatimonadaceae bacterium]